MSALYALLILHSLTYKEVPRLGLRSYPMIFHLTNIALNINNHRPNAFKPMQSCAPLSWDGVVVSVSTVLRDRALPLQAFVRL